MTRPVGCASRHGGIAVEPRAQGAQPAVGRDADRARALTDDPRDLGNVKPGHDTQNDYLGLLTRQRCDECECRLG
jgi:hypothetical protein